MEQERLSFADCLKEAQRLGYAEADPTFDIEGHDTAQKLVDPREPRVRHQGRSERDLCRRHLLDHAGRSRGGRRTRLSRQAARRRGARPTQGIEQRVHPTMVRKDSAIAQVMGVTNAVTIDADGIAPITLVGPGAGGVATASAVVADIADIARGVRARAVRPAGGASSASDARRRCSATRAATTSACWRCDRPGTAATIAKRLAEAATSRWNRSCSAIRGRAAGGDDQAKARRCRSS